LFITDDGFVGLSMLASDNTVYMDGTLKIVSWPFVQLFTIHAFRLPILKYRELEIWR